jgi:hypothetical protein
MRSRLDANQVLLLANCARSIEHSRARGVHWATDRIIDRIIDRIMDRIMYSMECWSREGQGMVIRYR